MKTRLKKLTEMAEKREYAELVKDVVPRNDKTEPFSSYKDQIGFGKENFLIFIARITFKIYILWG